MQSTIHIQIDPQISDWLGIKLQEDGYCQTVPERGKKSAYKIGKYHLGAEVTLYWRWLLENCFIPTYSKSERPLLPGAKWKPNVFAMAMSQFPVALATNFHMNRFSPCLNSQQCWGINQDVKTGLFQDSLLHPALLTWTFRAHSLLKLDVSVSRMA